MEGIGIMRRNLFWLSDEQWARIEPHLPTDVRGVERVDDRRVISGSVHVKAHRSAAGGKGGRKSRLWAVRAEGATRRFMHSRMLKGA